MPRLYALLLLPAIAVYGYNYELTKKTVEKSVKNDILESSSDAAFSLYMSTYTDLVPKGYRASPQMRRKQKKQFVKNLGTIRAHNTAFEQGIVTYTMSVNSFTVMSNKERRAFLGYVGNFTRLQQLSKAKSSGLRSSSRGNVAAPASLNWKKRGWVTGVKNQGGCGSCWTFPAAALLEFAFKKCTGTKTQFSEQLFLDCTYEEYGRDGCEGGLYESVWAWVIQKQHVTRLESYPYKGEDTTCQYRGYPNAIAGRFDLLDYHWVEEKSDEAIIDKMQIMPLAVSFHVEDNFYGIGSGIYDGCWSSQPSDHAVTMTAYTPNYWEIKNSWGPDWGDKGYAKFKRGRDVCNIMSDVWWITYKDLNPDDGGGDDEDDDDDDVSCDDDIDDCPEWSEKGLCDVHPDFMLHNCKLSCSVCGETTEDPPTTDAPECTDDYPKDNECANWANLGYCSSGSYVDFMADHCKVSCGFCDGGGGGGDLIPAHRVTQTSTWSNLHPEYAVDGDLSTQSHTQCHDQSQWFKYYFSGVRSIGRIKVVNGKTNSNKWRLDGMTVYAMKNDQHMKSCPVNTLNVREGDSVEDQTYYLDCDGQTGIGVWFYLGKQACLEFKEIEVYST